MSASADYANSPPPTPNQEAKPAVPSRCDDGAPDGSKTSFHRLRGALRTTLALAGLGVLAYWGHHTGWQFEIPGRQGSRVGADASVEKLMWADAGAITAQKRPQGGWCEAHGVLDCPIENPDVAELAMTPVITSQEVERIRRALAARVRPENDPASERLVRRVTFASQQAVEKLGIDVAPVWQTAMTEVITASGELGFDPRRVAHLSTRVPGSAWRVTKKIGDPVRAGEVLALIDSAEVSKAKAELQQALVQVRLKRQAFVSIKDAPVSGQQKREVEAALRDAEVRLDSAEQALINLDLAIRAADFEGLAVDAVADRLDRLGLPEDLLRSLDSGSIPGTLWPLRAPFDGTTLAVHVIAGEVVDPSEVLFVVADPRRLWLTLHVPPDDAPWVKVGQQVRFRPDGGTAEFTSKLFWIGTTADEKTRTVPVRAALTNDDGRLRAFAFGVGKVVLREEPKAVVVPNDAVHSDGSSQIVFVRDKDFLKPDGPKVFHARTVRVGARDGSATEIVVGVLPGEIVATKGSALLLNEVRKNRPTQVTMRR